IPFLKKTGYKHNLKVDVKDNNVRNIIYLIIPVFLGSYVDQINNVINRTLASTLDTGSITALNYANKLNVFAIGILVISISTIMYPILSKFASQNNMKAFKGSLIRCINLVIIIMLPIMVGMMVFATPIVSLLFEGGSFSSRDTFLTSTALLFYALGMVSFGIRDMLSRGFYSLQDTKTPVKNAVAAVFVDIVFSIILVKIMGIGGLALSTSISVTFGAILLMVALRKKIGRLGIKSSVITFLKAIIASLTMGLTVNKLYKFIITIGDSFIDEKKHLIFLGLTIATTIGALIYLILSVIFNIKEVKDVLKQLKSRILILLKK
ncbi:MAG: polysaccharide biosynthesis C-terminal domain-containing protein, partial [Paeniclostridium sp.]